jgi:PAS domain S-box-containing protein
MGSQLTENLPRQHPTDVIREREDAVDYRLDQALKEIAGNLLHGFAVMQEGKVVFANQTFAKLFDLMVDDLVGASASEFLHLFHPEDRQLILSRIQDQSESGYLPMCFIARLVSEVKPTRWLEFHSNRMLYRNKPAYLTSVFDITDQKITQHALEQSAQNFHNVVDTAVDAIVITDDDSIVQYWNRAAAEIFGYKQEEILGKPVSQLFPESMLPTFSEIWKQALQTDDAQTGGSSIEFRAQSSVGREFPIELSHSTWQSEAHQLHCFTIRDVTHSRRAQRRLETHERLVAVGQLASGIAHDFNNILGTIILQSEMLLSSSHISPKDRKRLSVIIEQSQRAASLTSQIQDFSHRTSSQRNPLDLIPFMQDMHHLLTRVLPEKIRVGFATEVDHSLVNADRSRLQQVFMNFALNARDAMPEGGDFIIEISRRTIKLGEARPFRQMGPGEWIRIRVSDTGMGIEAEHLPRVFEPFFTTKPPGMGSGLGLAQVYGIITQHDGFIDVQSLKGVGTVFVIHLPVLEPLVLQEVIPLDQAVDQGAEETILVVEEDASTRNAIGEILRAQNFVVMLAGDGKEALTLMKSKRHQIDLLLLDLGVHSSRGIQLHDRLREIDPEVPMMIMVGHPPGEGTGQLIADRHVDWIQKPFSSKTLSRKVRALLARNL